MLWKNKNPPCPVCGCVCEWRTRSDKPKMKPKETFFRQQFCIFFSPQHFYFSFFFSLLFPGVCAGLGLEGSALVEERWTKWNERKNASPFHRARSLTILFFFSPSVFRLDCCCCCRFPATSALRISCDSLIRTALVFVWYFLLIFMIIKSFS